MKACCRASRVRQLLPEHQKQWLSWLAARGVDSERRLSRTSIARSAAQAAGSPMRRPSIPRTRRPAAFLSRRIHPLAVRAGCGRAMVRAYLVHSPASALHRAGALQHDVRSGGRPGLPPRGHDGRGSAGSIPMSPTSSRNQRSRQFRGRRRRARSAIATEAEFRQIRAIYYGMISEVDAQLGRVWQCASRQSGAWDDTIVVLTSDHAEMMGDHLHARQRRLLRRQLSHPADRPRPAPKRQAAAQGRRFTEAVDILPTTLDLIGGDVPATSRRPFAEAVPRRRDAGATGATRRIGSSTSARSPKATAETAFRHQFASVQSRRPAHRNASNTCISAVGLPPRAVRPGRRSGRDAERRRRSRLSRGPARHGRAAACLACRASRPVAGALRTDRPSGVRGQYPYAAMKRKRPAPESGAGLVVVR